MPNMGTAVSIFKQSSDPASAATAGDLWSDTDSNTLYRRNDSNDGWLTITDTTNYNIQDDEVVMPYSTTIGDYTQPSGAVASSDSVASPNFETTFDSTSGWTTGGGGGDISIDTSDEEVNWDCGSGTSDSFISYDLGSGNVSDTKWILRFKLTVSNVANSSASSCHMGIGISSTAGAQTESQEAIGFALGAGTNDDDYYGFGNESGNFVDNNKQKLSETPSAETYYVQLRRSSATGVEIKLFTNSNYSDGLAETKTFTIASGLDGLRYIKMASRSQNVNTLNGLIEDMKFYNNIDSVTGDNVAAKAIDNDTATYWKSQAETNPNIYVDMGSNVNLNGIALFPNSDTTETEIKLQLSTSTSFSATSRTITVSNLTNGEYNYVRWNTFLGRYARIYGSSGASKILAINEIKVLKFTDSLITTDHGHLPISSTDTSLALNGT